MYKSKVRSIIESTYPLWCCANDKHMKKIERVQRIALLQISGAMSSTPTPMLEHILQIEPIKIRWDLEVQTFIAPNFSAPVNHSIHKAMAVFLAAIKVDF